MYVWDIQDTTPNRIKIERRCVLINMNIQKTVRSGKWKYNLKLLYGFYFTLHYLELFFPIFFPFFSCRITMCLNVSTTFTNKHFWGYLIHRKKKKNHVDIDDWMDVAMTMMIFILFYNMNNVWYLNLSRSKTRHQERKMYRSLSVSGISAFYKALCLDWMENFLTVG